VAANADKSHSIVAFRNSLCNFRAACAAKFHGKQIPLLFVVQLRYFLLRSVATIYTCTHVDCRCLAGGWLD
jgi:hypothetical protein